MMKEGEFFSNFESSDLSLFIQRSRYYFKLCVLLFIDCFPLDRFPKDFGDWCTNACVASMSDLWYVFQDKDLIESLFNTLEKLQQKQLKNLLNTDIVPYPVYEGKEVVEWIRHYK